MRIAIVYGGKSGEHEVSRVSASNVAAALDPGAYEAVPICVDYDGSWFLAPMEGFRSAIADRGPLPVTRDEAARVAVVPGSGLCLRSGRSLDVDAVFPLVHGTNGEDGTMQGLLEQAGLPYVGVGVSGSAVGMDKVLCKRLWENAGLPVVPFETIGVSDRDGGFGRALARVEERFGYPVFVKPVRGGSSVGASRAVDRESALVAIERALEKDSAALVEPFLDVREIECSVIGLDAPRAFMPGEVIPSHEYYDYEAKYEDPEGASFAIPARLDGAELERVRTTASRAYEALGLDGYARVDFFVERGSGDLCLNEVNTIPGFTAISMFPKMCAAGGLGYAALIDALVGYAFERHARKQRISYSR